MARIPLRAYNREIENLIERGQIEEAIAHCKNILKQFPKHIDTYRLLGKAFLESQRYTEAVDILQRVLSVFPDDFVSQLGMSIIREDEGNLDASIWHMERAYEVQPFNRAVQDELRRLYGRRDGAEPPKIRLNRGSLVRMYARGELFPQAIAEARAALAEDPQRVDLLVLLARMYYLSGQKVEAAEIASTLIGRLPYCYEANRILQDILPTTSRADEAKSYQQRVYSLAPYMAFITPNSPTAEQVPDQSVMVEKVDWQPNSQDQQGPDWARTIGVRWEQKEQEQLPDWLSNLKPQAAASAAPTEETVVEPADDIPDWMKSAGWGQSSGTVQEGPSDLTGEEEELPAEIAPSDIPEWLQAMAPAQQPATEDEKEQLDWLSAILPVSATAAAEITATPESPVEETTGLPSADLPSTTEDDQLPDWLQTVPSGESTGETELPEWMNAPSTQTSSTDNLDWLQPGADKSIDLPAEETPTELSRSGFSEVADSDALPDWLTETSPSTEKSTGGDIPEWLSVPPGETESTPVAETPDWLSMLSNEEVIEPVLEGSQPVDNIPDWLEEATPVQAIGDTIAGLEEPADQSVETTEWSQEIRPVVELITPHESLETIQATDQVHAGDAEEMPEDLDAALAWMEGLAARQGADEASLQITPLEQRTTETPEWLQQETAAEAVEEVAQPASDLPDWLTQIAPTEVEVEPPAEAVLESEEAIAEVVELPEWMQELQPAAEATVPEAVQETLETIEPSASVEEGEMPEDLDAALAWMEALAARQGADEASLQITPLDQRTTETPEWLQQESVTEAAEEVAQLASDLPDWLTEVAPAVAEVETPVEVVSESEEAIAEAVELPEWMQDLQPAAEATVSEVVQESPETTDQAAAVELGEMPEDLDAALAWMEALAARQGADEASLQITPLDQRTTETPEWLQQESVTEDAEEVAQPVSDLPDWLTQVAPDEAEVETPAEVVSESEEAIAEAVELPEWMQDLQPAAETPTPDAVSETLETVEPPASIDAGEMPEDLDAAMAWMEALAARQGADEASLQITSLDQRTTETPEWLQQQTAADAAEEAAQPASDLPDWLTQVAPDEVEVETPAEVVSESEEELAEVAELPGWMQEQQSAAETAASEAVQETLETVGQPATEELGEMPEDLDAALAWMEALAARQGAAEDPLKISTPEGTPSWLAELPEEPTLDPDADAPTAPTRIAPKSPVEAPSLEAQPPVQETAPETQELDEDFAWLESLAARQGADESTLVTQPAEREETPPKWVTGELDASVLEQSSDVPASQEDQQNLPEWLRTYEDQPQTVDEVSAAPVSQAEENNPSSTLDDLPEWLKGGTSVEDEQVTTWLEGLEEPTTEAAADETHIEQTTEWIQEPDFSAPTTPSFAHAQPGTLLAQAQDALSGGNLNTALDSYSTLINESANLDEIIHDLRDALYRYPVDVALWQTIGDAYIRNDQVQEALDAYTKAEELLR